MARLIHSVIGIAAFFFMAGSLHAQPTNQSCAVLSALGSNQKLGVASAIDEAAPHWPTINREKLIETLQALLDSLQFNGGNVYRVAFFEGNLEEHLVLLRLKEGEVAGMRMRYEWAPDGMKLVTLKFERKYDAYARQPFSQTPELLTC
ncbi:MAG: hypothetical protein AAGE61_06945 [Pseudomonadota bacterium]